MLSKHQSKWMFILLTLAISIVPSYFLAVNHVSTYEKQIVAYQDDGFYLWSENSAIKIDPNYKPAASLNAVNPKVSISGAKREFESTQLILRKLTSQNLDDISIALSPFKDSDGNEVIGVENQSVGLLELIRGEFFDRIIPLEYSNYKFNVSEDRNYPLWYTVYIPDDVSAGNYEANVTLTTSEGSIARIVIDLHVYDFSLPVQHTYQSMVNPMTSNLNLMENFFQHRVDFSGVPMNFTFNASTYQWDFYWDEWDELTNYSISRGQNQFMISSPRGYVSSFEIYSAEYNYSIATFYANVSSHLRLRGW